MAQQQNNLLSGGDGVTTLNYQEIALNLVFKFIDVLQAVAIIVVGMFAIRYLRRYLRKIEVAHESQRTAVNLLEKIVSGFFIVVIITLALKVIGLDLTLILSALTLGLSFGLKDIIKNYISGVLILFKSPFKIGDAVKIRSYIGKVEKIEFQSTTLKTFDRKEVTIYNKDILTQSIVNYSKDLERRIEIKVFVGHGTDLERAFSVFETILHNHPKVLKKPRWTIIFRKFNENGAETGIRFWVKRPCNILKIQTELSMLIQSSFDEVTILSPLSRAVEFGNDVSMTEQRKGKLQTFYGQPALIAIAAKTLGSVLQTTPELAPSEGTQIDEDEPEEI